MSTIDSITIGAILVVVILIGGFLNWVTHGRI